jgi:hypothetical protein
VWLDKKKTLFFALADIDFFASHDVKSSEITLGYLKVTLVEYCISKSEREDNTVNRIVKKGPKNERGLC